MNPSNYSAISFPTLGIEVNPARSITLGPMTVYIYGIVIALGLLLAVLYCCKRSEEFGLKEDHVLDGVLWITPFAIVCARAYYVLFSWSAYADNPISALYIWEGGIAIYGGVLGAIAGMAIFCRIKKIPIAPVLDLVLLGFLIGQSVGRWGNFFNREAFGAATESFARMGLFNTKLNQWEYYHPTFLYESLWNAAGFVLLHFLSKRRQYDGQIALGYAAWYGLGRCIIEGLRVDSLYWGNFRVSQLLAGVTCVAAVSILLWQMFKTQDPKKMWVNLAPAQEDTKEAEPEEKKAEESEESQEETSQVPEKQEETEEPAQEQKKEAASEEGKAKDAE